MIDRRAFLGAATCIALAVPRVSLAQQPAKVWRIGFLNGSSQQAMASAGRSDAYQRGQRELGFVERKYLEI